MKRRDFVEHIGWTGAGIVWTMTASGALSAGAAAQPGALNFIQISDSHIGFHRPENPNVAATLERTVEAINALPVAPSFIVHTGDITHLSTDDQFDDAKHILAKLKAPLLALPGEHDVITSPQRYLTHFPMTGASDGWFAFNQGGVHFVGIVNVFNFEKMGLIGQTQLNWLEKDLRAQKASTPIVVFGHVPLYALYPTWGWTTQDGAKALAMLARFEQVTVLNGHIHQVVNHTEGNIRFATAASTAYPQPAPGTALKPGPLQVPPGELLKALGYRSVQVEGSGRTSIVDRSLA